MSRGARRPPYDPEWPNESSEEQQLRETRRAAAETLASLRQNHHELRRMALAPYESGGYRRPSNRQLEKIRKQQEAAGLFESIKDLEVKIQTVEATLHSLDELWEDFRSVHGVQGGTGIEGLPPATVIVEQDGRTRLKLTFNDGTQFRLETRSFGGQFNSDHEFVVLKRRKFFGLVYETVWEYEYRDWTGVDRTPNISPLYDRMTARQKRQYLATFISESMRKWGSADIIRICADTIQGCYALPGVIGKLNNRAIPKMAAFIESQDEAKNARKSLKSMRPEEFERWVAEWFAANGYSVEWTGGPGDQGVDIVVSRHDELALVQCKRFGVSSVVSPREVRELYGALHHAGADRAYLVTTGTFSDNARMWAKGKNIELWDGDHLERLLGGDLTKNPVVPYESLIDGTIPKLDTPAQPPRFYVSQDAPFAIVRQKVASSNVASVGFDSHRQILEVEFRDGAIYRYSGVPESVYRDLMTARSVGRYMNQNVSYSYKYERLN